MSIKHLDRFDTRHIQLHKSGVWRTMEDVKKELIQFHVGRAGLLNASRVLGVSDRHLRRLYHKWGKTWDHSYRDRGVKPGSQWTNRKTGIGKGKRNE